MYRLSLDLDGVIYPWHEVVYDYIKNFIGTDLPYEIFWKNAWAVYGETFVINLIKSTDFYSKRVISQDVLNTLNNLSKRMELFYITSRPPEALLTTKLWLERNRVPFKDNLFLTIDKSIVVSELEIDCHVDDLEHNLVLLEGYTDVIMFKQYHNDHLTDKYKTIKELKELERIL